MIYVIIFIALCAIYAILATIYLTLDDDLKFIDVLSIVIFIPIMFLIGFIIIILEYSLKICNTTSKIIKAIFKPLKKISR